MKKNIINKKINESSDLISSNIDKLNSDRGLLSQNILSHLRTFVEHVALKIYDEEVEKINEISYSENIRKAVKNLKTKGQYLFISNFHLFLQSSVSHYVVNEESSERLMLKYYEFLIKTRDFLKNNYSISVLKNLEKFPLNLDKQTYEYYHKIAEILKEVVKTNNTASDRYYVQKKKPFFVNGKIYYELTVSPCTDYVNKFDRAVVFTKFDVKRNYAVKLWVVESNLKLFELDVPIKIAIDWQVSVRPCELENFAKIFGRNLKSISNSKEYKAINNYLTYEAFSLTDLIKLPDRTYDKIKTQVLRGVKVARIFELLDKSRDIICNFKEGSNILTYLLHSLINKVIKAQLSNSSNDLLSDLYLSYGCIPFDKLPFSFFPLNHRPKFFDLLEAIDTSNRDNEFLARRIKINVEKYATMYTPLDNLGNEKYIYELVRKYNEKIYYKHKDSKLKIENNFIFIEEYEKTAKNIIDELIRMTKNGVNNYTNTADAWINQQNDSIDCDEKKKVLRTMFEKSKLAMVYGAAGTGKSTLIKHLASFMNDKEMLFLAHKSCSWKFGTCGWF